MHRVRLGLIQFTLIAVLGLASDDLTALQAPASAPAREGLAPIPGAKLWYVDSGGTGVPVVFLHPATGSVRIWEYQIPAFTAAGYRFIAYDRRDFGRTIIDSSTGPQPGAAVDDLDAL